jgi:V/A-type H+-transporting ATPase subunit I
VAVVSARAVVDIERPEDLPEVAAGAMRIPILHRNPLLLRPFQQLVDLYGTPSYGEIQPTAFFAISFLLMFGLMFGDVGHGAVLFSAGYCLFRYLPRFLDYGILLMEAGSASMLFGVLYGSLFGIPGALPVLWMDPMHDLPAFLRIAVTIGIVLVSGGLVLNVVNSWRMGERVVALFTTRGLFGAFLYWMLLALAARAFVPQTVRVPGWLLGVLAAGAALLLALRPLIVRRLRWLPARPRGPRPPVWLTALEGSIELIDALFTYVANTMSFVRVAAFAAVHAGVFVAMFAVADTLARYRFGDALSIAALVAGNIVMILLEGLTVSVQVLRLEYFEFFGKFFRGGGELYRPLMLQSTTSNGGGS